MRHILKIKKEYYDAIVSGDKKFEIRKDDRGFNIGDTLILQELADRVENMPEIGSRYTGRFILCSVDYILKGGSYGIEEGYIIMSISPLTSKSFL